MRCIQRINHTQSPWESSVRDDTIFFTEIHLLPGKLLLVVAMHPLDRSRANWLSRVKPSADATHPLTRWGSSKPRQTSTAQLELGNRRGGRVWRLRTPRPTPVSQRETLPRLRLLFYPSAQWKISVSSLRKRLNPAEQARQEGERTPNPPLMLKHHCLRKCANTTKCTSQCACVLAFS
jgi:hypothetical protein